MRFWKFVPAKRKKKAKRGDETMTAEQINEVLKQRDPEWIRSFMELAKQYEGATPEHREKALEFLRERKG